MSLYGGAHSDHPNISFFSLRQSCSLPGPASNLYCTHPSNGFSHSCLRSANCSHSGCGTRGKTPSLTTILLPIIGVTDWIGLAIKVSYRTFRREAARCREYLRSAMPAELTRHWCSGRCVFVDVLFEVLAAHNLDLALYESTVSLVQAKMWLSLPARPYLLSFDCQITAEDPSSYSSTVSAMT